MSARRRGGGGGGEERRCGAAGGPAAQRRGLDGEGDAEQRPEPGAGAGEECDRGAAGAREHASAGMGQQVGRVGDAPGLQPPQPRGIRGSSAARPCGRRRDLAGRSAEAGFNVFAQHGECVREAGGAAAAARSWGVERGRGARAWGRNRCQLGRSRRRVPPLPLPSPAWLAAPGGGGLTRSGRGDRRGTVLDGGQCRQGRAG